MTSNAAPLVSSDVLSGVGLFGGLDDGSLAWLGARLESTQLEAGEVVFHEGDTGRDLYVVETGEMEVLRGSRDHLGARVALLGPGDWFGEMSVVDVQPRSATVRALAPARLLRLPAGVLDDLYRQQPKAYTLLILNIARELSRRLRIADGILAEVVGSVIHRRRPPAG